MDLDAYRKCELCPRRCQVNRAAGQEGQCGETAVCRIAHAGVHLGEEPCFSGRRGSGTIFFSGCSGRCFFCQNYQISLQHTGNDCDPAALFALAMGLVREGVHNLNFVTPDHFWPHVRQLCCDLRKAGVEIPFLYNCSGYQLPALVPAVAEGMEIFMPDFKFAEPALAATCMSAADYPQIALEALQCMVRARGFLEPWDESGTVTARRGVLVRHLVLPGHVANSLAVLRLLNRTFGKTLPLSVMSQYRPTPAGRGRGSFGRLLKPDEYNEVCDLICALGFERVYIQELADTTAFMPDFSAATPFAGNKP